MLTQLDDQGYELSQEVTEVLYILKRDSCRGDDKLRKSFFKLILSLATKVMLKLKMI